MSPLTQNCLFSSRKIFYDPRLPNETQGQYCGDVVVIQPKQYPDKIDWNHPIIADHQSWDVKRFETVRPPIVVGTLKDTGAFSSPIAPEKPYSVWDVLIKRAGEEEYHLPIELSQFSEAVQDIADFKHASDAKANEYDVQLHIVQSEVLSGKNSIGTTGTFPHVDGQNYPDCFQGLFVVSNCLPTVFYRQPFFVPSWDFEALDPALRSQAKAEFEWFSDPYQIVYGDRFSVHRMDLAGEYCFRTFLRSHYISAPAA